MAQAQTNRDEEALKKKTDCVYFLASPLTCKKGHDCEFRHSESARVNPRDCWYWLAGNCLMPDCPFRHPPLEGRTAGGATGGLPVQGAAGVNKARTPCYYFSQGYCAKGDKCPFLHGPATPTSNVPKVSAPPQKPARVSAAEGTEKKTGSGVTSAQALEKPLAAEGSGDPPSRPVEARISTGRGSSQGSPRREGQTPGSGLQSSAGIGRADVQLAQSNAVLGGNHRLRMRQPGGDDRPQNGIEPDEWWEESSPGFDVLVDAGPERSHYSDNPDLRGGYDGLDPGPLGPVAQRRGRDLHGADEIDQYDYEYAGVFEQPGYDGIGPYNGGGYEPYEQQGYESAPAYEQQGHQRSGVYGSRGTEEMYGRGRERMILNRDESGVSTNHRASQELKWPRLNGPPQHILENRSRRRTESGRGVLDELRSQRRMEEDPQKLHELHLRQQLFVQRQGVNKSNDSSPWQTTERSAGESGGVARRLSSLNMRGEVVVKSLPNGRENEGKGKGSGAVGDVEPARLRREAGRSASRGDNGRPRPASMAEAMAEGTQLSARGNSTAVHGSEGRNEQSSSTFEGPKTLAEILAAKRKGGAADESIKAKEVSGVLGKGDESRESDSKSLSNVVDRWHQDVPRDFNKVAVQSGAHEGKMNAQLTKTQFRAPAARHPPGDAASEEKKRNVGKSIQGRPEAPDFAGPKSLNAILQAKRKAGSETVGNGEDATRGQTRRQRLVKGVTSPGSDSTEAAGMDVQIPEVTTEAEDTELLSEHRDVGDQPLGDKESSLQAGNLKMQDYEMVDPEKTTRKDNIVEEIDAVRYETDTRDKDDVLAEDDDDDFGLDDEDDDFAKKLGGFFS